MTACVLKVCIDPIHPVSRVIQVGQVTQSDKFFSLRLCSLPLHRAVHTLLIISPTVCYDDIADCIMQEEKEHQAYLKRQALAAMWEAQKAAMELEAQRERDLQWFQETLDTTKVVGQFFFELCVKALPLPSLATSSKASRQDKHNSKSEAEKEEAAYYL